MALALPWCPSLHLHTNRSSEASHLQRTWLKSEEQPICFFKFLHKKKRATICGSGTKAAHLYFPAEDRTETCEITTQQPQKRQNSWLANAINHLNEICKPKLSLDKLPVVLSFLIAASINTYPLDAYAFVTAPQKKLQSDELATVRLFKENTPSVVYITNLASRRDVFTLDVMEVPQGSGSGFVWDKEGHIVTNFHVIRGASDLR